MNDRFLFRVWHIPTKELLFVLDFGNYFIQATPSLVVISARTIKTKDCILEQCTGLKDKNGKLIYEGDIVKEKLFNIDIAVIKFGNGSGFQCFYPEWKGRYSKETKYNHGFRKDLYFWLNREEGLEVIGNIHENPELLEGK